MTGRCPPMFYYRQGSLREVKKKPQKNEKGGVWERRGFPGAASGKEPACQCRKCKRSRFNPWVGKIPWRRKWQPTPVFLPGESHGQRSLVGYNPEGRKESDRTEGTERTGREGQR